jgi:hypothetical protein
MSPHDVDLVCSGAYCDAMMEEPTTFMTEKLDLIPKENSSLWTIIKNEKIGLI